MRTRTYKRSRGAMFCSRCSRRREYQWIILLAILLVLMYTYLYSIQVGSKGGLSEEVYGAVLRGTGKVDGKLQVSDNGLEHTDDKPWIAAKQDGPVSYKDPQQVDDKAQALNEIKSNRADSKVQEDKVQVDEKNEDDRSMVGKEKLQTNGNTDPVIKMREIISEINKNEVVLNDNKFPSFGLVMIIQVHRRIEYLKMLLESLRDARDISEVLLVVSFDYYDEELFSVVDKVDFCKVVKIFFPKSLQLYPNEFPGDSPNSCPRDISQTKAKEQRCIDADHPDSYGHYREAAVTAIKHHWWWKINHLFDEMRVTADYNGFVIFLEEDLYVAPDIVPVTKQLISLRDQRCQDCDLIGLGLATKMGESLQASSSKVDILGWRNNLAYAIDRQSWNNIKKCSKEFCTFDDYNWDWTLYSLQGSCYHRAMKAILLKAPRAYHTGTCGTHQMRKGENGCNWNEAVTRVRAHITANKQYYFPVSLNIVKNTVSSYSYKKGFGGWGDPRDHALCLSFVHGE